MTDTKLKAYVDRVESVNSRIEDEQGARRDIFAEAKGVGYDVKVMRKIIQRRKLDAAQRAEQDDLQDTYEVALGMAVELVRGGASLRQAERETGIAKSVIHRAISVPASSPEGDAGSAVEISLKLKPACIYPRPVAWQEITASRDAADAAQAAEVARIAAEKEAERQRRAAEREAERLENMRIDADTLEIPAHLDRRTKDRRQNGGTPIVRQRAPLPSKEK